MGVEHFLTARVLDKKAVLIECNFKSCGITVFGSTVKLSAIPGTYEHQFIVHPEPGKKGIIALVLQHNDKTVSYHPTILEVVWKNNSPVVELAESWATSERVGHVSPFGIEVMLPNGRRFASHGRFPMVDKSKRPLLVPDGDLLCRYLFGTAKAHEVLHTAVQHKLETNKDIVKFLEEEAKFLRRTARTLHAENCQLREDGTVLRNMLGTAQVELSDMVDRFKLRANAWATWAKAFKPIWQSRRMQFLFPGKHQQPMPETKALIDGSPFYLTNSERHTTRKRLGMPAQDEVGLIKAA